MTEAVNTKTVAGHRELHFATIDDVLAEIDRIVAAEDSGTLTSIGNWSPGQILTHVAAWIDYAYDGYPLGPPPFFVRWILRMQLRKFLTGKMPRGVRIPRVPGGTYGADDLPAVEAAERLRAALKRLETDDPPNYHSPAFGPMSHHDRIQLNLRHAELHLGFLNFGE